MHAYAFEARMNEGTCWLCCSVLGEILPTVLSRFKPDLVLYDAGVDPHMHDSLGKLALTDAGLLRRELQVDWKLLARTWTSDA